MNKGQEAIKNVQTYLEKNQINVQIESSEINHRLDTAEKRISELEDWRNCQEGITEQLRE